MPHQLEKPLWNPYFAGILLGLVLIASYLVMGTGVGSSRQPSKTRSELSGR